LIPDGLALSAGLRIDPQALGYTLALSVVTGLVFGLAPALQASKADLNEALKQGGGRSGSGAGGSRLRGAMVVAQVALALVLLVGAGLMIRSFLRLQRVNPGFAPDRVLTAEIVLPQSSYREAARVGAFQRQLLQRVQALPGVESASVSMALPPNLLIMRNPFAVEGPAPPPGQSLPLAEQVLVSPDYFRTLGIQQLAGRAFTDADDAGAPQVVIINETLARQYFPQQDPVGKRLQTGDYSPNGPWLTIVGVVADVKYSGLNDPPQPALYTSFQQNLWWRSMFLAVKAGGDPLGLVNAVRNEVWALDRGLPVSQIKTMDQLMSDAVAEPRAYTLLLGALGMVALLLAAVGIYGVMSYAVTQRTHEIGVRMALGAQSGAVLRLVVGAGMKLALLGMAIGLLAAFALTRLMSKLLFDVSATDPVTFAQIALLLMGVAFLSCYLPARRATKVDPMAALRCE
jgi:putative ABC transport system permease protein